MTNREKQAAYCPPQEDLRPMRDVVALKLRSMMHNYLNGAVAVAAEVENN